MSVKRFNTENLQADLADGVLILTPNHRISTAILDAYAAQLKTDSWITPRVYPVDLWIKRLWLALANQAVSPCCEFQILESAEEFLIWSGVIEDSLPKFPLLNPDETAALASRAYQDLRQWSLDEDVCSLHQYQSIPDVMVFAEWQRLFQDRCKDAGLITLVDAIKLLIELITSDAESIDIEIPPRLVTVNFYQPPPLYQSLFDCIADRRDLVAFHSEGGAATKACVRHEFSDARFELAACADWIIESAAVDASLHIGIISNQDGAYTDELQRILADRLAPSALIELSKTTAVVNSNQPGPGLIDSGLINDALLLLNLNLEQQDSEEFCRLLQSPHMPGSQLRSNKDSATEAGAIDEIDERSELEARLQMQLLMRQIMSTQSAATDLSRIMNTEGKPYHCPQFASAMLEARTCFRRLAEKNTPRVWARLFTQQLEIFGWPGTRQTSAQQDLLREWQQLLSQFASSGRILGKIGFQTALAKIRALCLNRSKVVHSQSKCQVSLYTPEEALGLSFSHLWFLGFDDQSWPPAARPSPFLPHALQRQLELPNSNSELQYQQSSLQFGLLCDATSLSIVASHHLLADDQSLRPSNFILRFPLQVADRRPDKLETPNSYGRLTQKTPLQEVADSEPPQLTQEESVRGGHSIISKQSSCPFRAFASHRLHAYELREFESGLSSMARGTAMHQALEHLFRRLDSSAALAALDEDERQRLLEDSSALAIEQLSSRYPEVMTPRFREIERDRMQALLQRFLRLESERPDFTTVAWEFEQPWQLHDKTTEQGGHGLRLNLQIDRVDRLADGSLALIDYKTGALSPNKRDWLEDSSEDMQLPVYYCALSHSTAQWESGANTQESGKDKENENAKQKAAPITALSIAHVNVAKIAYSGISRKQNFHKSIKAYNHDGKQALDWTALTAFWESRVNVLASDFSKGVANVSPAHAVSSCRYCGLDSLCRIRELSAGSAASEDETGDET